MVRFVIALGLFCCDCYRQVFHWLQPFRRGGTPGRSTFCEARPNVSASPRCGSWPIRSSVCKVSQLRPAQFYCGMRTMALDGFVVDVPDTPANDRASVAPKQLCPDRIPPGPRLGPLRNRQPCVVALLIKPQSCGEVTMAHYYPGKEVPHAAAY